MATQATQGPRATQRRSGVRSLDPRERRPLQGWSELPLLCNQEVRNVSAYAANAVFRLTRAPDDASGETRDNTSAVIWRPQAPDETGEETQELDWGLTATDLGNDGVAIKELISIEVLGHLVRWFCGPPRAHTLANSVGGDGEGVKLPKANATAPFLALSSFNRIDCWISWHNRNVNLTEHLLPFGHDNFCHRGFDAKTNEIWMKIPVRERTRRTSHADGPYPRG